MFVSYDAVNTLNSHENTKENSIIIENNIITDQLTSDNNSNSNQSSDSSSILVNAEYLQQNKHNQNMLNKNNMKINDNFSHFDVHETITAAQANRTMQAVDATTLLTSNIKSLSGDNQVRRAPASPTA